MKETHIPEIESDEPTGGKFNLLFYTLWGVAIILGLLVIATVLDISNVVKITRLVSAPRSCDYVIRPHYKLMYSDADKNFVIYCDYPYSGGYLDIDGSFTRWWDEPNEFASKFSDSCRAKGALEKYLKKIDKEYQRSNSYK